MIPLRAREGRTCLVALQGVEELVEELVQRQGGKLVEVVVELGAHARVST